MPDESDFIEIPDYGCSLMDAMQAAMPLVDKELGELVLRAKHRLNEFMAQAGDTKGTNEKITWNRDQFDILLGELRQAERRQQTEIIQWCLAETLERCEDGRWKMEAKPGGLQMESNTIPPTDVHYLSLPEHQLSIVRKDNILESPTGEQYFNVYIRPVKDRAIRGKGRPSLKEVVIERGRH